MADIGYHLSSEEHDALKLVEHAEAAEAAGFGFATISDHFHPWLEQQGHSPFVWSVLGGIARATSDLELVTAVTCPTFRIHPAVIAQAAATTATMLPGRFVLGVGTGERLNEHILGDHWPPLSERIDRLGEAIRLMRELWKGELVTWSGEHYRVENAQIFDRPEEPLAIYVAAAGPEAATLAGEVGDGLISLSPEEELLSAFDGAGGAGKVKLGMTHVCWAESEDKALATAREWWRNTGVPGLLNAELSIPEHYAAASELVTDDVLCEQLVLGTDPEEHAAEIRQYLDAGFDRVSVHQIGPEQDGFLRFFADQVRPLLD